MDDIKVLKKKLIILENGFSSFMQLFNLQNYKVYASIK